MKKYRKSQRQTTPSTTPESAPIAVRTTLEDHIRQAFQERLPVLLDEELQEHLGRAWYAHHDDPTAGKQYRNGYGKMRTLNTGVGSISVQVPRLRTPWQSQIVQRYQRLSDGVRSILPDLYLHGMATGDFALCLHALLGEEAPLSEATIVRLKQQWKEEYARWRNRRLQSDYLYVWLDGVYPKAGPREENLALLTVVGANRRGEKELLAVEEGYRESTESWRDLFRALKRRGVQWIGLVVADGVPGVEKALRDVFPGAKRQRCWLHKMRNVLDKVPEKVHDDVQQKLRAMYHARSREEALCLRAEFVREYRDLYPRAVTSLLEAGDQLFTYFDFPRIHWPSIKSTNVIESTFSSVKLRTDAARRIRRRDSATFLVFKLLRIAEQRWHRLNGYRIVAQTIDQMKLATRERKVRIAA